MSPNNEAFWSVRCFNGKSYSVMLTPNPADGKVLECSVIEALGITPCFKKFPSQVSRNLLDPKPAASPSYKKGLAALDEDDLDAAIAEFTAAITDDPNNVFRSI